MLVVSLMLKVVSPPIVQSIICMDNTFDIWNHLNERFSRDIIHISDHQEMISSFKKNSNNDEQNHEGSKTKGQSPQFGFTPE